jgi:conjugal transfer mating pair stabilization protein TraG
MTFVITTYGAGEVLDTTFNAIATLINSKTGILYQPLVRLSLIIGLLWTVVTMVHGNHMKFVNSWMIPFLLALMLFFAPTCRVIIHDPVSGNRFTIDHVPWGLGAVAGVISRLGDRATREIEKTFSLPDDLKYHKTGAVMASNLIASARTFHVTNSDLAETLRSFVHQCVVYEALLGKKYTFHDLKNAPDIWELVSSNSSPARSFTYKAPVKNQRAKIITCEQGVNLLNDLLQKDVHNAFQFFGDKVFGKHEKTSSLGSLSASQLKQYLPQAFDYMTQMAKSAEEYMMQQMMVYAVVDSIESQSTALGNAPNFAIRRAYLQQRANQETLAGVAAQKLIAMKNVMEALIYASFIFILPLALLPSGWSFISRWIGLVLWVQLWPPLYAILNFIMNVSVKSKGLGLLTNAKESGITIANSVGFMNLHADMAAQAGFMSLSVGALAYALVKGGAASFVHLASHMAGPSTAAASRASEDLMSGNYSFGNVSQGTVQAYNASVGQQNFSPNYTSGSFTQNDGVISRTTGSDGGHIISVANSNLRSSLNFSESLSNSYSEQASQAKQMSETQMVAAANAEADHNRQVMDFSTHKAKQTSGSESYSTGTTASTNQAFTKLDGLVDRFAKDHSISKETAAQVLASASAFVETGVGFHIGGTGASARFTGGITGQMSGATIDRDLWSQAQDYSKQSNFQEALSQASQAAHDSRYSELSDQGKRVVDSLNASLEKSHQYREEASASLQKSKAYSQMASCTKQNAGSINESLNQEYVNWLQTQSLPNSSGPMGIREAETLLISRPELDHHYQQRFMEEKMSQVESYMGANGLPSKASDMDVAFEQAKTNIPHSTGHSTFSEVEQRAREEGLGPELKVSTEPRDYVQKELSSVEKQLAEQQGLLGKQAEMRKAEIGSDETKPVKNGIQSNQPVNIGAIQEKAMERGTYKNLISQGGESGDILARTKASQPEITEGFQNNQMRGIDLKAPHTSHKNLKEKLSAIEDQLIEQREFLEKQTEIKNSEVKNKS